MTTTLGQGNGRNHNVLMFATAAAFLAAVLFASTAPAHAKDHGHNNNGNHGRGHQAAHAAPRYYAVPKVLTPEYRGSFQPYYNGRTYYAPHHHYHAAYRLPVYYGGAVVYRPYSYCEDHLFVSGAVTLPRMAIAFNFGAPGNGFSVGGYYQSPPPVAYYSPAPYYAPAPYYYDERYDRRRDDDGDCHHGH